jgi:hypothetical protein
MIPSLILLANFSTLLRVQRNEAIPSWWWQCGESSCVTVRGFMLWFEKLFVVVFEMLCIVGRELPIRVQGLRRFVPNAARWVAGYKREGLAGLVRKGRTIGALRQIIPPKL